MNMKSIPILICCYIFFLLASCTSSNKKSEETKDSLDIPTVSFPDDTQGISEVITRFARAYLSQDNEKANALIHPDLGLYVIYRPGAQDTYERVDSIDFAKPVPEHFPYTTFANTYALSFEELPSFDCGMEKWNKLGFFCDTTVQANELTAIATFNYEFNGINDTDLAEVKQLEKGTFRVMLTKDENLIFHVKKHQGNWYVFVLDRAYGWCDA